MVPGSRLAACKSIVCRSAAVDASGGGSTRIAGGIGLGSFGFFFESAKCVVFERKLFIAGGIFFRRRLGIGFVRIFVLIRIFVLKGVAPCFGGELDRIAGRGLVQG